MYVFGIDIVIDIYIVSCYDTSFLIIERPEIRITGF